MLAVDPSSPFTGGAILGDRVRMQDHATDPGVFIRSMATRGHLGGLSLATPEAIRLLDAVGYRWILVETVGVGQVEVEVAGQGRHHRRRRQPRLGRQRAGEQGRPDGGRRRLRHQQGRPARRATRPGATSSRCSSCPPRRAMAPVGRSPIMPTVASTGDGVAELWETVDDPPRARRRRPASSSGAAGSASARSCARSSPAASSSVPARCAPASAGRRSPTTSSPAPSTRGRPPTRCSTPFSDLGAIRTGRDRPGIRDDPRPVHASNRLCDAIAAQPRSP